MSFSNLQYLYDHLPGRYRREDTDLFLKRFLQWFGETLDGWDEAFDSFDASITPATAAEIWVRFWILQLFGWAWFPWWFTLTDLRRVYGNFARHLARRGTRSGIEKFLRDFGIIARVHTRSQPWGEFVWGETSFTFTQPLRLVIEIFSVRGILTEGQPYGEFVCGESYYTAPRRAFTDAEIAALVRYQQPQAQEIVIIWGRLHEEPVDYTPYWRQRSW